MVPQLFPLHALVRSAQAVHVDLFSAPRPGVVITKLQPDPGPACWRRLRLYCSICDQQALPATTAIMQPNVQCRYLCQQQVQFSSDKGRMFLDKWLLSQGKDHLLSKPRASLLTESSQQRA